MSDEKPQVADPETGEIRILEDRCGTCVLNPDGKNADLRPGRLKQFVGDTRAADGHVVCHSTVPPAVPAGTPAAMCRGYVDAYGLPRAAQDVIRLGLGHLVEVPDPKAARA
ncbi:hypothetical protein [Streptomyces parvulus]|uniref:hypothetical protein n=1 Tax=Streptomyces parvulus TaxID=146923 RepID=UPI0037981722